VVDVYVGYLRRKLGTAEEPVPIFTVRAVGYRLGGAG
jgi:DNA-binding response OmpR family regulator